MQRKRDKQWYETVLETTQDTIRAYIAGLGVPLHAVDDVAQETFLVLYKQRDRMPDDVEPRRWLKGIAYHRSMDYFRNLTRDSKIRSGALVEIMAQQDEDVSPFASAYGALRYCLEQLSRKNRNMIDMKYKQKMSARAIGQEVDMNETAVRVALLRLRKALRDCVSAKWQPEAT